MPPRRKLGLSPRANRARIRSQKKAKQQQVASSEHPFGNKPLEPFVMPPKQVRELRPRAKQARIQVQMKAEQQEVDKQSSMVDVYLPEHVLQQIFLRMPTKPLVQLKCLSKQWNRQISDPNFMKLRARRMIFFPSFPFHAIDNTETGGDMFKLYSPSINPDSYQDITIVGSFNGILFLVLKYGKTMFVDRYLSRYHMILYNPLTGESKTVPQPGSYDSLCHHVYGFGYGSTMDDLKIIRLKDKSGGDSKSFEVFSLKTWAWSKASELIGDYCIYNSYSGTFADGFLYWDAFRKTNSRPLILAFDIKMMVFSEIEVPDGCRLNRLGTYNGRLCMICSQVNVEGYELRVMNERGCLESFCSLAASSFAPLISHAFAYGDLCILNDGKLLISVSSQQLIIDDMLKHSSKLVNVLRSSGLAGRLQSVEYVESTISPSDICTVSV